MVTHQIGACHKCTSGGCRCNILHVRTFIDRVCRVSTHTNDASWSLAAVEPDLSSFGRPAMQTQSTFLLRSCPAHPSTRRRQAGIRSPLPSSLFGQGRRPPRARADQPSPRRDAPPARPAFLLAAPNLGPSRLSAGGRAVPAGTPAARPEKARTNRRPRPPSPLFLSPPPPPLARSIQLAVVLRVNARAPPAKKNPPRRPAPATARPHLPPPAFVRPLARGGSSASSSILRSMRRFLPTGGGGGEPSSSSSSGAHRHHQRGGELVAGEAAGLRYDGGGGDISLGHGRGHDAGGGHRHHHQQLGGAGGEAAERQQQQQQDDGSMDMLARHSSSPAGFFSNLMVDNGEPAKPATIPLITNC